MHRNRGLTSGAQLRKGRPDGIRHGGGKSEDERPGRGVEATVPLLLALLALSLAARARGTRDAEDGIWFERNSEVAGPHLRVFLTLTDGSEASVSTADDAIGTRPGETPIPGHVARDWTFPKDAETGTTFAHALVSWDLANPADYLIAVWRIPFPG